MALEALEALDALRALGLPLVAAINGDTFGGGCELAAACDLRIAEEHARFHWVQARFAVTTAWGGAGHLVDLVGRGTAARWLLTARPVEAREAHAEGFVEELAPKGEARARALAFIDAVAAHPRHATTRMLKLLRAAGRVPQSELKALELMEFGRAWASREHHEAVAAFLARRR